ncbi:2'-5' RNA ligase family protein [Microbacterium candidum]|uniref:2'-5' RNA ligase family protein n=1 Tax=Microbacterium candidum TaxID=3041922 RepID=A0ABT7N4C7_9MICO|nr:2'-5' RNA ligase family protein [Microbacterium sp. ASV49]MDL9981569.1 2'-5' RNA ligase family protein [Microbacterium sp. ASV49]
MSETEEMDAPEPRRYVIVALFDPIPAGATIDRRRWPAHVTLLANFSTIADEADVVARVGDAVGDLASFDVELGAADWFGRHHDVPVLLVRSKEAVRLHERLADELASLNGHAADEPGYMRNGYRPHLTLGPDVSAAEGDRRAVKAIALADLRGPHATVVASFDLVR